VEALKRRVNVRGVNCHSVGAILPRKLGCSDCHDVDSAIGRMTLTIAFLPHDASVHCPRHDSPVLLTRRNTIGFWNGPDGPVLRWRCRCGQEGSLDRLGSHADPVDQKACCSAPAA
jgi:hypothetical protein